MPPPSPAMATFGVKRHSELTPWRHEELTPWLRYERSKRHGRSRCGTALSVAPKAARRLDAGQFVEIEVDDRLQGLASGAVAQCLGQRLEPHRIFGL